MADAFRGIAVLVGWMAGGVAVGATGAPKRFPPGPWLTDVRIVGPEPEWSGLFPVDPDLPPLQWKPTAPGRRADGRKTGFEARSALTHPLPEWWQSVPWVRGFFPVPSVDQERLRTDTQHVEHWFQDHGWLDCSVTLELSSDDTLWGRWLNRREAGAAVRATYVVDIGARWTIGRVELTGLDGMDPALQRDLEEVVDVAPGVYDGAARVQTEEGLALVLAEAGFAHPEVNSVLVPVDGERTLTMQFHVQTGPIARFGPLEIHGLPPSTEQQLQRKLSPIIADGTRWNVDRLSQIEAGLGNVSAMASVEVVPGPMAADQRVPVRVEVTPARDDGFRPILSVASDPTLYAMKVGLGYRAHRVGKQVASVEALGTVGYRSFPIIGRRGVFLGNHGPSAELAVAHEVFLRPVEGFSLVTETTAELEPLWANNMATGGVGLGGRLRSRQGLQLTVSPEVAVWQSFPWPAQQSLWDVWFVTPGTAPLSPMSGSARPAFRPFALGSMAHVEASWSRVDVPLLPTRGGALTVDAIPYGLAGADPFSRVHVDIRRFLALGSPRWVLVPRLEGGLLHFHEPHALAVPQLRFRLGGGTSLRGWGVAQANPPGWDGGLSDMRIGGNVLAMGSLEVRYALWPRLHLFGFSDVGRTWERLFDEVDPNTGRIAPGVQWSTMLPAAGAGFALPTPVGRAALSGAVRLREETELVRPPPMGTIHFVLVQNY